MANRSTIIILSFLAGAAGLPHSAETEVSVGVARNGTVVVDDRGQAFRIGAAGGSSIDFGAARARKVRAPVSVWLS